MRKKLSLWELTTSIEINDETVRYIYQEASESIVAVDDYVLGTGITAEELLAYPHDYCIILLPMIHKKDMLEQYFTTISSKRIEQQFIGKYNDFTSLWIAFMRDYDASQIEYGWFQYLRKNCKMMAIRWCNENHLLYVDDM